MRRCRGCLKGEGQEVLIDSGCEDLVTEVTRGANPMIQAEEAIRAARADRDKLRNAGLHQPHQEGHPHLCGRRQALHDGGDERAFWNSFDSVPKYRHLIWRQSGISGAKPGMLAFMGVGTGDVSHTGLVTERGTVIHSSKSRGGVVETALTAKAVERAGGASDD